MRSLLISLCLSCSNNSSPHVSPSPAPLESLTVEREQDRNPQLENELAEIARQARGRVGVAAKLLGSKQTVLLNSAEHFPMQSVYKLPISMAVVQQVDQGKLKLDQMVRVAKDDFIGTNARSPIRDKFPNGVELSVSDLLRYAISESDGTASDVLMKVAGGPEIIQSFLTTIGIADMKIIDTEKALARDRSLQYRNWTTPDAAVALLESLDEKRELSQTSRSLLMKLMAESTPGKNRLKGLLPAGTYVAHKTGTSGTQNGVTAATNDIGIITLPNGQHLAIAVFVSESPAVETTREGVIAQLAKRVFETWK
ncbi:MAG: serine hydrolase [Acidobacteria bacterium]|nr:MAG: serine hydrolase [Acidobacteriota bacterium]